MTFKPEIWRPIAIAVAAANLVFVGFTAGPAQPWHAAGHAALALVFGLWAQRMRKSPGGSELEDRLDGVESLQDDVAKLRQELSEAQERMDFFERLLAQGRKEL
jgi:hypothetical protein